jgi:hypothetical protein
MVRLAVFAVFCRELLAMDISGPQKSRPPTVRQTKKAAKSLAVFRCICERNKGPRTGPSPRKQFQCPFDEISMSTTISQRAFIVNFTNMALPWLGSQHRWQEYRQADLAREEEAVARTVLNNPARLLLRLD